MIKRGKLAEGRVTDAVKSYGAGMLGTYTNMLPAQMVKLVEMGLNKSKSHGVNLDWVPGAENVRLASSVIDMLQDHGRSLDAKQFDRGKDFAPLADELVMLPLDMIGVGEAPTLPQQRPDWLALGDEDRPVLLVADFARGVDAQAMVDRRGEVRGGGGVR